MKMCMQIIGMHLTSISPRYRYSICVVMYQSIMGGIRQGARCLAYTTAPLLAVTPRESPCRLPSYTE